MSATKLPSPESLAALVTGVTETMLGIRFDLLPESREAPTEGWRAAVIPIQGDRKLAVAVAADLSSARDLTAAIFYCEPNEVEAEMIDDALRELSNIVGGQVKVSMNVEVPVAEFDQVNFASNLATLLGIDPSRIRVADVRPVRRLLGRTLRCI